MTAQKSYRLRVVGLVQGVGFRVATQQKALGLGLKGWVCNRSDGAVEVSVAGQKISVEQLIMWLWRGPPAARVEVVHVMDTLEEETIILPASFEIL